MAYDAAQEALARVDQLKPLEASLIRALPSRYPQKEPIDDMSLWDKAFAQVMTRALREHPESLDVRAVAAESLMNLTPWKMWDLKTGTPTEHTPACRKILEEALDNDPKAMAHPGVLHSYVHLMEMSPTPEAALKAGDALRTLAPDAGHLVHMPTHIDVQVGNYQDAVFWN